MEISCSWCHEINSEMDSYCKNCGHEVGRSRLDCNCYACKVGCDADRQMIGDDAAFFDGDIGNK
jgi:hypothetical protein